MHSERHEELVSLAALGLPLEEDAAEYARLLEERCPACEGLLPELRLGASGVSPGPGRRLGVCRRRGGSLRGDRPRRRASAPPAGRAARAELAARPRGRILPIGDRAAGSLGPGARE